MKLVGVADFARRAGISHHLASRIVSQGDLPSVKIGSRRMIAESAIQRWQKMIRRILDSPVEIPQNHGVSTSLSAVITCPPDEQKVARVRKGHTRGKPASGS
jgi:hypothetical protein